MKKRRKRRGVQLGSAASLGVRTKEPPPGYQSQLMGRSSALAVIEHEMILETRYHKITLTSRERDLIAAAAAHSQEICQLVVGENELTRGRWLEVENWLDAYLGELTRKDRQRECLELSVKVSNAARFGDPSRIERKGDVVTDPADKPVPAGCLF